MNGYDKYICISVFVFVFQVFMGVLIGTMSLGQAMPNLEFISTARGAAAAVWEIIDLVKPTLGVIFYQSDPKRRIGYFESK